VPPTIEKSAWPKKTFWAAFLTEIEIFLTSWAFLLNWMLMVPPLLPSFYHAMHFSAQRRSQGVMPQKYILAKSCVKFRYFSALNPARKANNSHLWVRGAPPRRVPPPRQIPGYAYVSAKRSFAIACRSSVCPSVCDKVWRWIVITQVTRGPILKRS